jgi:hypothetical protein
MSLEEEFLTAVKMYTAFLGGTEKSDECPL